jgi:hypothetical protein
VFGVSTDTTAETTHKKKQKIILKYLYDEKILHLGRIMGIENSFSNLESGARKWCQYRRRSLKCLVVIAC